MSEAKNPFITLEAVMEHVQSAGIALREQDPGTSPQYHLEAAEAGVGRLFQSLVKLLPGLYSFYQGEPTDTILDQIEEE